LKDAVARVRQSGADVLVRINRPLQLAIRDIEQAPLDALYGLCLPKVDSGDQVRLLSEVIDAREAELCLQQGTIKLLILVESALGIHNLSEIANANKRVVALAVGGEDLATDMGGEPSADCLYVPKMLGLIAARAAGIVPVGVLASVAGLDDDVAYRAMVTRSRRLGFECATCVHPRHVPILNELYAVTAEELAKAEALLTFANGLGQQGEGAFLYQGMMIDAPALARARRIKSRASVSPSQASGQVRRQSHGS
jgi:citrate lyase subunit beta/citryl-CoA lyase